MGVKDEVTDNYSLRGRVFHTIRDNILKGVYEEHEELREMTIVKELGVSRTPVREALRQLELEQLVTLVPNKGAYVTGITAKDVKDIYLIRSLLEGLCARMATEHITQEQLDELEEIVYLAEFHARKNKHQNVFELDGKFHEIMYLASGSKMLHHVLKDFHNYVRQIRQTSAASRERAEQSVEEHKLIIEAIREKDADRAERLANEHMINVMKYMETQGIDNMLESHQEKILTDEK